MKKSIQEDVVFYTKKGDLTSCLANISAVCYQQISDLNWVGFYIYDNTQKTLLLGPFQGKPAVAEIVPPHGLCGAAYATKELQVAANVQHCDNHIVCDINSKSELVLPIFNDDGSVWGVFDIDSPQENRFDEETIRIFLEVRDYISRTLLPQKLS